MQGQGHTLFDRGERGPVSRRIILIAEMLTLTAVGVSAQHDFWLGVGLGLALSVILGYINFADGRKES